MEEITPAKIKEWLKSIRKDRAWLADQTKQSLATVNGWLAKNAPRKINPHAIRDIQNLMDKPVSIDPVIPSSLVSRAMEDAEAQGISMDEWIARAFKAFLKLLAFIAVCSALLRWAGGSDPVTAAFMGIADAASLAGHLVYFAGCCGVEVARAFLA